MADTHRIEVATIIPDARAAQLRGRLQNVSDIWIRDVYTIQKELNPAQLEAIAHMLTSPVTQTNQIFTGNRTGIPEQPFDWSVETGFLPGVTDNVGHTAREGIEDMLGVTFSESEGIYSSQLILIKGAVEHTEVEVFASEIVNRLIQRSHVYSHGDWQSGSAQTIVIPQVKLREQPTTSEVDLEVSDDELVTIGQKGIADADGSRRGPLALDLAAMQTIQSHFRGLGRKPTDIELESIAQTWSEHCKHTIFADPLDDITDGIYKTYIKAATLKIRQAHGDNDLCVSVFTDNSGAIRFDDKYLVTHKVETHNSPSALDPFGGAITGIVGVNRDTIGFGLGAKPVINVYGFCLADPSDDTPLYRDQKATNPILPPARIMNGVVAGVNAGGNQSGIPSPQGFLYFDKRYKGKPLVFAGTVGLIPAKLGARDSHIKKANPGDLVVMVGGRVGLDGIHGATFSSVALDESSPATAVQIGDPITQKKLSDAIVKEARDLNLYSSITDNGAGGLSCSVAEMAQESGGFEVQLERVPLKYPNLAPWQTWISESQERMTLAIPPEKWDKFQSLMARRGVEATVIGTFTGSGRCLVSYHGKTVLDLDIEFLHNGLPKAQRHTDFTPPRLEATLIPDPADWQSELLSFMGRLNLASKEFVSKQYDHEVQAGSVLKPLQGRGRVNADTSVTRPLLSSPKAVALSQGLYPSYSELDPYAMAAAAIDTAIRNLVAAGTDPDTIALLDNFCWCSSNDPMRLGQLKLAAQACYDIAVAYGAPFISGKDSMFNDFKGFDKDGQPVQVSVPPTLLISSIGLLDDAAGAVSIDLKAAGDLLYLIGTTRNELGGSEYAKLREISGVVPAVDATIHNKGYRALAAAIRAGLVASSISLTYGGLATALIKTAMAGRLGLTADLSGLLEAAGNNVAALFSESQGRILVSVERGSQARFEAHFEGIPLTPLGAVTGDATISIASSGGPLAELYLNDALAAYRAPLENY